MPTVLPREMLTALLPPLPAVLPLVLRPELHPALLGVLLQVLLHALLGALLQGSESESLPWSLLKSDWSTPTPGLTWQPPAFFRL